jgi:hypothetical protein
VRPKTVLAGLTVIGLLATGCGGRDSSASRGSAAETAGSTGQTSAPGSFGGLKQVCGPGTPSGAPAKGVTAKEIQVGVFTDLGMTKNSEFPDAAKVFTSWCNEAGGINGRKLVANTRDAKLLEVRPRMLEACADDFALVGGGTGFDSQGVRDRLSCLLPDFPAQTVQPENAGSDLQVSQFNYGKYNPYAGSWTWLMKEKYPDSAGSVGLVVGDNPVTALLSQKAQEGLKAAGGTVTYVDKYPPIGAVNWAPYAQAIKSKGVKGLLFYGQSESLAMLERELTTIGYKLDWIDANSNSYRPSFISLAGPALAMQNNYADLGGVFPLERAVENPATAQVLSLYQRYGLAGRATYPGLNAFSSWLLFAKAATSCGDNLTRKCLYENARKETAWTGGGLRAPIDLSNPDAPPTCFNVEQATSQGWQPADFKPNEGSYRCGMPVYEFTGRFPKPVTLADVSKSLSELT